jgi:hypothetical protein
MSPFRKKAKLQGCASPWTTLATLNSSFSLENVWAEATLIAMLLMREAAITEKRKESAICIGIRLT